MRRRASAWASLASKVGRRYQECELATFDASGPRGAVRDLVRGYCDEVAERINAGVGVLLFGPPGTGKDHLAVCIMRAAVEADKSVEWTDGAEFYGAVRDNIESDRSEADLLKRFTKPDLLVMSDPLPPRGVVDSAFQLSMLFRIIDRRYRDQRATVMTMNVKDRAEAEERLSANIVDRIGHGALAIHCNWESYRRR